MTRIVELEVVDLRFPTSRSLDGSDAMNPDPDYSAAYVILAHGRRRRARGARAHVHDRARDGGGRRGRRGAPAAGRRAGRGGDGGRPRRVLAGDGRRLAAAWIGPEKGAIHLATAAVVNAVWDLVAKRAGKPVWRLLADMTPAQIVALVDFRYLTDALTPEDGARRCWRRRRRAVGAHGGAPRRGYPAYTTSVGWLGYDDDKVRRLAREALADGWTRFKMKVGADVEDDVRRAAILREELGPDRMLAVDANQRWDVGTAIAWMDRLRAFDPYWIEEPTSPDDILGHAAIARGVAPIRVATGEHVQNRIMFKQFLAAGAMAVCQIDACRLGGVNEVVAVLLLAARFGVPVCPHAGGVGLCELVQHLAASTTSRSAARWTGGWSSTSTISMSISSTLS